MPKGIVTRHIKTTRPITQSELIKALKNSMDPLFEHFEEKLLERDGQILDIQISADSGHIALKYSISKIEPAEPTEGH